MARNRPQATSGWIGAWLYASARTVSAELSAMPTAFDYGPDASTEPTGEATDVEGMDAAADQLPPELRALFLRRFLCQGSPSDLHRLSKIDPLRLDVLGYETLAFVWQRLRNPTVTKQGLLTYLSGQAQTALSDAYLTALAKRVHRSTALDAPRMSEAELGLFKTSLATATRYFEFGVGGSTLMARDQASERRGPEMIVGVDTDPRWIERISTAAKHMESVTLLHIDIGPVGRWGYPINRQLDPRWPDFPRAISRVPNCRLFDLVLIDARFRMACLLEALLSCPPDVRVLFHDFGKRREYAEALRWAVVLDQIGSLALLARRPGIPLTRTEVSTDLQRFYSDPS